ncbi:zinc-binding oxidoreductase CipB [Magnaporthiopsis poae ATCC 64411]|uniref:Zinc-binding oxidoreductase CipB n=1 Tax=Magnaporthiopsis poae (strain ATCC 64411 / 73-15) TaxID=644358 RepID=A0A0C4DM38_MAGP6|nr:zinc-binding oxidoreductase CipB [Magnaporthiopsis poae ATCC 64411]
MAPQNMGAFLVAAKARPLDVREAPYPVPGPGEIVVKNAAVALNPIDYIKQSLGNFLYSHIKYPFITGCDVAGVVVDVGPDVTRFKVGDRVVGNALGMEKKHNKSSMCGFQLYTVLLAKMTSPVPESISLARAAVIPLGLSTASCGLFQKDQLGLRHPSPSRPQQENEAPEVVLIWGGSSSVGCNAIQLATAAGYQVVTTCSPKNFDLVRSLGAKAAFDYGSKTVVDDVVRECRAMGGVVAGAMSIGTGAAEACVDVLGACGDGPGSNRFVSMISYPNPPDPDAGVAARILYFMRWSASMWLRTTRHGVKTKFVWGASLEDNEVGKLVYEDFLPAALRDGVFVPAPDPQIIGTDLGAIQDGLDMLKKGVSAAKLVVLLDAAEGAGVN